jgi:hypothetical protein
MKKSIFLLLVLPFLFSCSQDKILIKNAEKWLLTQLNDPDSFKRESFVITEYVTNEDVLIKVHERGLESLDNLIYVINKSLKNEESFEKKDDETKLRIFNSRKKLDSLLIERKTHEREIDSMKINKDKNNDIFTVLFLVTYRAKNSYGAYVKEQAKIRYYYSSKKFEIPKEGEDPIFGYKVY